MFVVASFPGPCVIRLHKGEVEGLVSEVTCERGRAQLQFSDIEGGSESTLLVADLHSPLV